MQDKGGKDDDPRIAWLRYCHAVHYGGDPGECANGLEPDGPALDRSDDLSAELLLDGLLLRLPDRASVPARLRRVVNAGAAHASRVASLPGAFGATRMVDALALEVRSWFADMEPLPEELLAILRQMERILIDDAEGQQRSQRAWPSAVRGQVFGSGKK